MDIVVEEGSSSMKNHPRNLDLDMKLTHSSHPSQINQPLKIDLDQHCNPQQKKKTRKKSISSSAAIFRPVMHRLT